MNLVFMGTPDFAVPSLSAVLKAGHKVVGVFTQPDKKVGRKQIVTPPAVKAFALEQGLIVYQPNSLKTEESQALLRELAPDCIVVVAYGKLLPKEVLELPRYGCVNVHGSLLPKYRGAAPIQWAVLNGETITGVTTMQMDVGLDTGDMLETATVEIGENETSGELFDRLAQVGADLLVHTLAELEQGKITPQKQEEALATYTTKIDKSLSPIDFTKTAQEVHNQVRGLAPWPVAQTTLQGKVLKIHATKVAPKVTGEAGVLMEQQGHFYVCCKEGAVELLEVQAEGKKRMTAEVFFRGKQVPSGTRLGETL